MNFTSTAVPTQMLEDARTIAGAFGSPAEIDADALASGELGDIRQGEQRVVWKDARVRIVMDAGSRAVEISQSDSSFPMVAVGPNGETLPSAASFHDIADVVNDFAAHLSEVAKRAGISSQAERAREREAARPRPYTEEEARAMFLDHVRGVIKYWAQLDTSRSIEERISGAVFSTLVALDGEAMELPGYEVRPLNDAGNTAWAKANGMNWYDEGCDIGGSLHDQLHT